MASVEDNKRTVRAYLKEAWDEGRPEAVDKYMSPEFGSQGAATSGGPDGRAAEKGLIQGFLASFGKFTSKIEDQLGEGNKVATRWSATGVHQGDFLGIPATGRTVTMTGTEIARFDENGKIAEIAVAFDMYGLLEQLR